MQHDDTKAAHRQADWRQDLLDACAGEGAQTFQVEWLYDRLERVEKGTSPC